MKFHPGLPNFEILKVAFEFVIPSVKSELLLFFIQEICPSPNGIRSYCATSGPCLQPRGGLMTCQRYGWWHLPPTIFATLGLIFQKIFPKQGSVLLKSVEITEKGIFHPKSITNVVQQQTFVVKRRKFSESWVMDPMHVNYPLSSTALGISLSTVSRNF